MTIQMEILLFIRSNPYISENVTLIFEFEILKKYYFIFINKFPVLF